jgi:hypothetical protein
MSNIIPIDIIKKSNINQSLEYPIIIYSSNYIDYKYELIFTGNMISDIKCNFDNYTILINKNSINTYIIPELHEFDTITLSIKLPSNQKLLNKIDIEYTEYVLDDKIIDIIHNYKYIITEYNINNNYFSYKIIDKFKYK